MRANPMLGDRTDESALRCGGIRHIGDVLGELLKRYQIGRAPFDNRATIRPNAVAPPYPLLAVMEDEPCSFCPAEPANVS